MNSKKQVVVCGLLCAALTTWKQPVLGGVRVNTATYAESLAGGDEARAARQFDRALAYYESAVNVSANNTERALALSKKGEIYAFDRKDYAAARSVAEWALFLEDVEPVARVTALQVLAECQMKADKNYQAATVMLEQAAKLPGVAWAQPFVAIKLGDCYRFEGRFEEALAAYQSILDRSVDQAMKAATYMNIGMTYHYGFRDIEKAKAAYTKAGELKPDLKTEIAGHLAKLQ